VLLDLKATLAYKEMKVNVVRLDSQAVHLRDLQVSQGLLGIQVTLAMLVPSARWASRGRWATCGKASRTQMQ
jgi:hypothetical protein